MSRRLLSILRDEGAQALVEYALVTALSVGLALVLLTVFSKGLFAGVSDYATRAMLTELPVGGSLSEGANDVLDLLAF